MTSEQRQLRADIGDRIRQSREIMRMTRAELAAEVGIKAAQLSNVEAGRRRIYAEELHRAARALRVPVSYLVGDINSPLEEIQRQLPPDVARLNRLIGARIRRLRASRRVTLEELADQMGRTRQLLSLIEKGEVGASVAHLFHIAAGLGCHPIELLLIDEPGHSAADLLVVLGQVLRRTAAHPVPVVVATEARADLPDEGQQ